MDLKRKGTQVVRLTVISACTLAIAFLLASRGMKIHAQSHVRIPLTTDWSNRHMVYSAPSSMIHAWRLQAEPRYLQQWVRRHTAMLQHVAETTVSYSNALPRSDWGYPLLATGTGGVGQFPAKFTFDVTATPDCTNDFVVFNRGGNAGVLPTAAAVQTGTFTLDPAPGGTVRITSPEASIVLTASSVSNLGTNFLVGGGTTSDATNLAAAIVRNNVTGLGVTATSAGNVVTVRASALGAEGNLIALADTLSHFSWGGARLANGVGRSNIVAFNQLYSTQGSTGGFCNQNGPSVYWSYFTGTGTASTSVVLSQDGTKVAFVESATSGAILRIVKWKAGQGTGAGYPATVDITVAAGHTWAQDCTIGHSCMSSIAFSGGFNDTISAPFYDFRSDTLYVGDAGSFMHKFTGIFNDNSAPTEVTTGWPIHVYLANQLSGPVFDSSSGNIFVGSAARLFFIRDVGSTKGTCTPMPCLEPTFLLVGNGGQIVDSPLVDGSAGMVFAVNGADTSANHGTILQATTDFSSSVSFAIGGTSNGGIIYSGDFDNTYITSSLGNIKGHMYVCGKDPANARRPAMYQLSFNPTTAVLTGVGTPLTGLATADGVACSPVTEFYNPNGGGPGVARDWIFFSIGGSANSVSPIVGPCLTANAGCLISMNVTGSPAWPPATVASTASLPARNAGASSAINVDNISTDAQASSIYFSLGANSTGTGPGVPSCNTTAAVGCAVKLTQSGLQ